MQQGSCAGDLLPWYTDLGPEVIPQIARCISSVNVEVLPDQEKKKKKKATVTIRTAEGSYLKDAETILLNSPY